jgi:hypothetical protein
MTLPESPCGTLPTSGSFLSATDLSGLIHRLGMVKRTDELSLLPAFSWLFAPKNGGLDTGC